MLYREVFFLQDYEATEAMKILRKYGESFAVEYLAQWDYGEGEIVEGPTWGTMDTVYYSEDDPRYILNYNQAVGYIGLREEIRD